MTRRRRAITLIGALVVLFGGLAGGWFAAGKLQSPAQVAANASPPPPADITATVTVGALTQQITARSEVARESATSVNIALASAGQSVVTAVGVPPGSELAAGAAVLEVNGRPVIATTGAFPYYRDMVEGDTGPDVEQLQQFLQSRGFATGGVGAFGPQTARAVRQLYRAAGYEPLTREETSPAADSQTGQQNASVPPTSDSQSDGAAPLAGSATTSGEPNGPTPSPVRQIVVVPQSELIVVATLPAAVGTAPQVGTVLSVDNSLLTFGQGPVVARAKVAVAVLPSLAEGMPVVLTGADGATLQGTLGAIPSPPSIGDETVAEVAVPVVTAAIDDSWLNTNVLTTITVSAVAEEALRVPSRAVALRANGTGVVQRLSDDGSFREVEVRELGRLGGTSAIEPISPGELSAGDQVNVE